MGKVNGVSDKTHTKTQVNDYANQKNSNNPANKAAIDNKSNQKNPNNNKTNNIKK